MQAACRAAATLAALATACLLAPSALAAEDGSGYEFGRGVRLGASGLTLGGYATAEYSAPRGEPDQLKAGHLSAFVWWDAVAGIPALKAFTELDLLNATTQRARRPNQDDERRVSLERLYLEGTLDDALVLRGGKFLTPIGRWNLIHADPLTWTTTRPLATQSLYPHNVTGVGASGQLVFGAWNLGYSLYGGGSRQWRADRFEDPFAQVRGLRLVLTLPGDVQVGTSQARYRLLSARNAERGLAGLDLFWAHAGFELTGEWLHTWGGPAITPAPGGGGGGGPGGSGGSSGGATAPGGNGAPPGGPAAPQRPNPFEPVDGTFRAGFVQGAAPVAGRVWLVGRIDWLRNGRSQLTGRQTLIGVTWRPSSATSLKLEWVRAHDPGTPLPEGFYSSVSLLF